MGLWVARGIYNSKPITCPSKVPVLVAHLDWLMYPHGPEMGFSSPSSLHFNEQDCLVAAATPAVISVILLLTGFWTLACVTFAHLLESLFTHSDFCGPYLGPCVHLQKPWTARERVDLCISERIHMPEGEEGLYYMLHDGGNNISSSWWDEEIRELLAGWHDTFCQIKMIPDVHLSASIYQNNAFTPRLHFSSHPQYFHLLWICLMWIFFFLLVHCQM